MRLSILFLISILSLSLASAGACKLDITLLNQDPYPAVQGDYVELVFQLSGVEGGDCDDISFELLEDYPIVFDPGQTGLRTFSKVRYLRDYESNILIPYKVRVDNDALDGANPIEVRVQNKGDAVILKTFDLEVGDSRVDFEIYVKDYDYATKELTLEFLNIGESDIEALTIEIPKQNNIQVKGSNKVIVGDLDSNEYTSADFEATPKDGIFKINMIYSDAINVRRTIEKDVSFDSTYFTDRVADQNGSSRTQYLWVLLVLVIVIWYWRRRKKNKAKAAKLGKK